MIDLTPPDDELVSRVDQRTVIHAVSWAQFEAFVDMRGDCAGPRISYLDGELEIISPSRSHERLKTTWACLFETWADAVDLEIEGYGAWLLKTDPKSNAGIEPDECYVLGTLGEREIPDFALEVVWTNPLVDKIEIYRRLGVREIWVWQKNTIHVLALRNGKYERQEHSDLIANLDFRLFERCLREPSQTAAVKLLRAELARSALDS